MGIHPKWVNLTRVPVNGDDDARMTETMPREIETSLGNCGLKLDKQ